MTITVPELCLVCLVGPSGSGKSTLARRLFRPTEVLSSDAFRGMVADDENDQSATPDAFDALHYVAAKRLAAGRLTVVDATNARREDRAELVALARALDVLAVAVALKVDDDVCHARNAGRADRAFGPHVVRNQNREVRRSLRHLRREGFRYVHVLDGPDQIEAAALVRQRLWTDRRDDAGPFDIVGDVHGCHGELCDLLRSLGYAVAGDGLTATPPAGRKAVFLGDLVDRGPDPVGVLRLVRSMASAGDAVCVPGNHDVKLLRALRGKRVQPTHGLAETLAAVEAAASEIPNLKSEISDFLDSLVSHYVLDGGRLVVAHAGMKEAFVGRSSGRVRDFALYGETTGEDDSDGLPVRLDWAAEYRGAAAVAYGHTPVGESTWRNGTINLDTGCAFGGRLTALRWPERDLVSVDARRAYAEPMRPFLPDAAETADGAAVVARTPQQADDGALDLHEFTGKHFVDTRLAGKVAVRAENAAAALEVMGRFAVDPRWLVHLPPTMSPTETSSRDGLLEHPAEAFDYFRRAGVGRVVCQRKHMGSRAVVVACRDAASAARAFGVDGDEASRCGTVYTRTGRAFFADAATESAVLSRVRDAATRAGLWDELATDWLLLDCELMPWSAKALDLLRTQYAPVGSAALASMPLAADLLRQASARHGESSASLAAMAKRFDGRASDAAAYVEAYRRYCWPTDGLAGLRLAPFHLLATDGAAHADKPHAWHLNTLARLCAADGEDAPLLLATESVAVELSADRDAPSDSELDATAWWERLTAGGGEGMVVKPADFVTHERRADGSAGRAVQPAVKCRGREYLRIIYGPEYDRPEHLSRLRSRGVGRKRSLASREFAVGVEGLERLARREPLRRVHACAFAVLALESEPVDPRL